MIDSVLISTSDGCKYGCIVDINQGGEIEVLETKPRTFITSEIRRLAEDAACEKLRDMAADKAERMLDARDDYRRIA